MSNLLNLIAISNLSNLSPMLNSGKPMFNAYLITMSNLSNSSAMSNLSNSSPMSNSGKPTFNAHISNNTKSFKYWDSVFGHVNLSVFRYQMFYKDGSLLPILPKSYDCEPCSLAKSIHYVRSQSTSPSRASKPLELIHLDLSVKAPVPSLGGSYYYLTFIDDYTCYT